VIGGNASGAGMGSRVGMTELELKRHNESAKLQATIPAPDASFVRRRG
jgi:hypothetical protein